MPSTQHLKGRGGIEVVVRGANVWTIRNGAIEWLTPHSLRRTFASVLVAVGEDPAYVMPRLGHADPALTLRIDAKEMARRDGERERLRALVEGSLVTGDYSAHVSEKERPAV